MARTVRFSQVLWVLTTAWLAACGRLGFDANHDGLGNGLPDAGQTADATPDAPPDAPVGPKAKVAVTTANLTTECGANNGPTDTVTITNDGDQPLALGEANLDELGNYQLLTAYSATTLAKGQSLVLEYRVPDAQIGDAIAGEMVTGKIRFPSNIVNANGEPQEVVASLSATVVGANIRVKSPAGNLKLTYASKNPACPAAAAVTVTNTGNRTITIDPPTTFASGIDLRTDMSATKTLASGASFTVMVSAATSDACAGSAQLAFSTADSALCTDSAQLVLDATLAITDSSSGFCFCP